MYQQVRRASNTLAIAAIHLRLNELCINTHSHTHIHTIIRANQQSMPPHKQLHFNKSGIIGTCYLHSQNNVLTCQAASITLSIAALHLRPNELCINIYIMFGPRAQYTHTHTNTHNYKGQSTEHATT
jgi:hypothetical protein